MGKLIDLTGQQFGKLTVIKRAENNKDGGARWNCQCECGNTTIVDGSHLRSGNTKSCGCLNRANLIGQKFGHLTVIDRAENIKSGNTRWNCKCDCGNEIVVRGDDLRNSHTQSCGCIRTPNLIGQKFGRLTVINRAESDKFGYARWNCKCDCGNKVVVRGADLRKGDAKSCGCLKSIGEANIKKLLLENNISYKKEYTFEDLKDKHKLRFDFAIFDNDNNLQYLVEFDGEQHFKTGGWNDLTRFEYTKLHDQMKNDYCKEHNIPLIRIPYTKRDNLTIEDLILETSEYLI